MNGFRKWLAFGTGVGIEVRSQDLQVTIVRVRPSETGVLGSATVSGYSARPAAEWGAELSSFLRQIGAKHIAATVLLPRDEVIVRTVSLPGVSDRDLEAAIRLQMDALHPFAEEDVYFSWTRLPDTPSVLVGIARKEVVDRLHALFTEAGIKIASFTFSAAALYSAIRLGPAQRPEGFLVLHERERDLEVYGESSARLVFSAAFPPIAERAASLAKAELRLEPETEPLSLQDLLPKPSVFPPSHDPATPEYAANALPYATALAGACPWLSLDGNLLPGNLRRASSRVRLVPSIALGSILLVMAGALAAQSSWADKRYLGVLQHQIRRFEPQARKVEAMDKAVTVARARTQLLDDYHRRAKHDLDALAEITKLIPPPGWVASLEMDRQSIQVAGEADQAAGLLKVIDNSPLFERAEFTMPINRTQTGDAFRIRAMRSIGAAPPQSLAAQPQQQGFSGAQYFPGAQPAMPGAYQAPVSRPPPSMLLQTDTGAAQ